MGSEMCIRDRENTVFTSEWEFFQDVLNWPSKLDFNLQSLLYLNLNGSLPPLTEGVKQRANDLMADWQEAANQRDEIVDGAIASFNQAFAEGEQSGLIVPDFTDE